MSLSRNPLTLGQVTQRLNHSIGADYGTYAKAHNLEVARYNRQGLGYLEEHQDWYAGVRERVDELLFGGEHEFVFWWGRVAGCDGC